MERLRPAAGRASARRDGPIWTFLGRKAGRGRVSCPEKEAGGTGVCVLLPLQLFDFGCLNNKVAKENLTNDSGRFQG
jgi:hypothetical protein